MPDALPSSPDAAFDVVPLPLGARAPVGPARGARRDAPHRSRPGGVLLVNVPSWRGKRFLELSAFRLGASPADEMDDHKCYYDPRDLWPMLVAAGFRPQDIRCHRHKFGLNTFAVCRCRPTTEMTR